MLKYVLRELFHFCIISSHDIWTALNWSFNWCWFRWWVYDIFDLWFRVFIIFFLFFFFGNFGKFFFLFFFIVWFFRQNQWFKHIHFISVYLNISGKWVSQLEIKWCQQNLVGWILLFSNQVKVINDLCCSSKMKDSHFELADHVKLFSLFCFIKGIWEKTQIFSFDGWINWTAGNDFSHKILHVNWKKRHRRKRWHPWLRLWWCFRPWTGINLVCHLDYFLNFYDWNFNLIRN